MAGSYPDTPGQRMAWDIDGTVVLKYGGTNLSNTPVIAPPGPWVNCSQAEKNAINDESRNTKIYQSSGGGDAGSLHFCLIFPEPRDVYGMFDHAKVLGASGSVDEDSNGFAGGRYWERGSPDSTNGISGTWEETIVGKVGPSDESSHTPMYRLAIESVASTKTYRAMRWFGDGITGAFGRPMVWFDMFHVYGEINAAYTPDRLLFIDANTGLQFTEVMDWGDVARGTTLQYPIWIRNNSTTLTASDIDLYFSGLTGPSSAWYSINDSGGAFSSTINIASISPTATYPAAGDILVKLAVPVDGELSVQAARLHSLTNAWA